MSTQLKRRLERIEARTMPIAPKVVRMLAESQDDAPEEARQAYARDLAQADAECNMIIIIAALKPLRPYQEGKRIYVKDEMTAQFQMAAHLPSKRGNSCLLADAVQDAVKAGRVLQTVTGRL